MKRGLAAVQTQIAAHHLTVTSGGGAVKIKISGTGDFLEIAISPALLKEDPKLVGEAVLAAVKDATKQAKDYSDAEMLKITSAFQLPGMA